MQEHVLSLNDFNMPKVFDEANANYVLIIRLLLLEKGKFQSHPDMGVDIRRKYRYRNDNNVLLDIQKDIKSQMSTYLPQISYRDISVTLDDLNRLGIIINSVEGAYTIGYDRESDEIDAAPTYVLNNL